VDYEQIIIIALFMSPWLVGGYLDYRAKIKALEAKINNSEKINLIEENKSIKHRLEVLEAIVTDKGYDISENISRIKYRLAFFGRGYYRAANVCL